MPHSNSDSYVPPTSEEISGLVLSFAELEGARLQEIELSEDYFCLGFYSGGPLKWLVMDLRPKSCGLFLLRSEQRPPHRPQKKPLVLFLNSHARDHRLLGVSQVSELGRVVELGFQHPEALTLRMVLIPSQINVSVHAGAKNISLQKPRELRAATQSALSDGRVPRSSEQITAQWLGLRQLSRQKDREGDAGSSLAVLIEKKRKAIAKVQDELMRKSSAPYRELGAFLVQTQSLDVPEELRAYILPEESLSENIERAFARAKELEQKQVRTKERLDSLNRELMALNERIGGQRENSSSPIREPEERVSSRRKPGAKEAYRARTLKLGDELEFQTGKSAKDNLALLRQSRAWDLWLHIKDQPGSHGILFRPKNKSISDEHLRAAAVFLLQSSGPSAKKMGLERAEILVAECRFVRPIKGDKLGRVTYHSARTLLLKGPR